MSDIREYIRRNPERLSQQQKAKREATRIAMETGRYVTRGDGSVRVSKTFVNDYVKLYFKHEGL